MLSFWLKMMTMATRLLCKSVRHGSQCLNDSQ
jgi:hypothetical protein